MYKIFFSRDEIKQTYKAQNVDVFNDIIEMRNKTQDYHKNHELGTLKSFVNLTAHMPEERTPDMTKKLFKNALATFMEPIDEEEEDVILVLPTNNQE